MSRIRSKDTKPEILVRKGLHASGFRFRLQDRTLPGRPDIILPKYGVAIMVNGCFWHGHKGCKSATRPKTNAEFWEAKITRNIHRISESRSSRLDTLADEIRTAGILNQQSALQNKENRRAARQAKAALRARQALLEAELATLYTIPKRIKKASLGE